MNTSLDIQGRLNGGLLSAQARSACLFFLLLLLFYSQGAYAHGVAEGDKGGTSRKSPGLSSMHKGAWVTLEGNVISQQDEWYTFRDPTGTIKVRIPQKVWNGQHFDAQDLVRVSGQVIHENGATSLDVGVISKP